MTNTEEYRAVGSYYDSMKEPVGSDFVAYREKEDYDDGNIDLEIKDLIDKVPDLDSNTPENTSKKKGKRNRTQQLYEKYGKIKFRNRLRYKASRQDQEKKEKISLIQKGGGQKLQGLNQFQKQE